MQQRPVIGIPRRPEVHRPHPGGPPGLVLMNQRYFHACTSVGAIPWMVPLLDDDPETLRAIYDRLDGIFLPGGVDMDPQSYRCDRHDLCGRTDPPRDTVELAFARWANEDAKPVLGVCRGMQVVNVAAGGTLVQDCGELFAGSIKHDYYPARWARTTWRTGAHRRGVAAAPGLRRLEAPVNSMHHQGLGDWRGVVATAWASDGLVEAVESAREDHFLGRAVAPGDADRRPRRHAQALEGFKRPPPVHNAAAG